VAGLAEAHELLGAFIDLQGWAPATPPDDWSAIHDSGRLDALACAYVALRLAHHPERTVVVGTPELGQLALPADRHLSQRVAVNLARLRAEGAVGI
jgi:hypothetical protein